LFHKNNYKTVKVFKINTVNTVQYIIAKNAVLMRASSRQLAKAMKN